MSRVTSQDLRQFLRKEDPDDVLIFLVTITHDSLDEPIRISSDNKEFFGLDDETKYPLRGTTSRGKKYYDVPFSLQVPDQPEDSNVTRASISIDNVTQELTVIVREMYIAARLTIEIVRASSPDVVEKEMPKLIMKNITNNETTVSADLELDDYRIQKCPAPKFYPSTNPGLH